MKRTWSPPLEVRACRFSRVCGGRSREVFRWVRRRVMIEWEVRMKESRRGREVVRGVGDGRGGVRPSMSSLETCPR